MMHIYTHLICFKIFYNTSSAHNNKFLNSNLKAWNVLHKNDLNSFSKHLYESLIVALV